MWALTIWQPWASLIVAGAKPYEFRSWKLPLSKVGRPLGIHAGARPIAKNEVRGLIASLRSDNAWRTCLDADIALPVLERCLADPTALPRSAILGVATMGEPIDGYEAAGALRGTPVNDSDRHDQANWAWPMLDVKPLVPIVPTKGAQGFWWWEGRDDRTRH